MTLLEKMCAAVWDCRKEMPGSDWKLPDWAGVSEPLKGIVRAEMRAALAGARTPDVTLVMKVAGRTGMRPSDVDRAIAGYIDAALGEPEA